MADRWAEGGGGAPGGRTRDGVRGLIPLAADEIHIWLTDYGITGNDIPLGAARRLLSDAERTQETRFVFAEDRRRYLVRRTLVRTVLSRYVQRRPESWAFAANAYGRPHIANPDVDPRGLTFNLSHTAGLIALAVARGGALGLDVENLRTRLEPLEIAGSYFAPSEVAALGVLAEERRHDRFFEYWTFKEAYIKAREMGLSLPLDAFSFRFPSADAVEVTFDAVLGDDPARWQFWQFRPTRDHLLALCAQRSGAKVPKVVVRQGLPLAGERLRRDKPTRTSP